MSTFKKKKSSIEYYLIVGAFGVGKHFRSELKVPHFEILDFEFVVDLLRRTFLQISLLNDQMSVVEKEHTVSNDTKNKKGKLDIDKSNISLMKNSLT